MGLTALLSIALAAADLPPLPDLSRAEPQVRAAITEDRAAVLRDPENARLWGQYGSRLAAHEYLLPALAAWEQAQRLAPNNFRWPYLTGVYLSQEDPRAALAAFERALELNERYAPLHLRYGSMMERLGRPDEARRAYRRAVELQPRNAYAHAALGGRLLDDGDMDEARRHLDRALALDESCRPALTWLVAWHRLAGEMDAADELARRAEEAPKARPPDRIVHMVEQLAVSTSAVLERAAALSGEGSDRRAIEILRRLVEANPGSARGRTELADLLVEQGRLQPAEAQYRAALDLVPDMLRARLGLAKCLARGARLEEARQEYETLIAAHPTSDAAQAGLAVCLAAMGRLDEALAHFERAVELAPDSIPSRVGYGRALIYSQRLEDAIEVLGPVAESARPPFDEMEAGALELAAAALSQTGRHDEAVGILERVLAADPENAHARRRLAATLSAARRDREAAALLREGMAIQPRGGRTALALAWILATSPDDEVRNGPAAVRLAERWLTTPTPERDGRHLDILACAYAEAGRYDDAAKAAAAAIDLATEAGKTELAAAMTARLELFKQGRAYRAEN